MANHVCHFEIPADDVASLEGFYSSVFGWSFEPMPGSPGYDFIKTSEGNLGGGMLLRQDPHQGPVNYICVESIDDTLEQATSRGAKIIVPKSAVPEMGWYAVLFDPQRNAFGLWQDDRNAA
jgi:predicted enzyme related to lactoylglutathione lyase